ncbi:MULTISPECIES: 50S ribosomal protein L10 [Reichenbachiella]|uniref:Large ribosomal subunit protein uL10 n=1 Tax=Reichenbachiella agariperforans TaxID=156994 RepID=A0A1M6RQY0_REIAG|nr:MULTISPECIES: 50S ribosomal protein L10 [Reichenbachiella]MBU2915039.1 50S ribosomal protein L10 [Reichenbachiella agariperforans]RJE70466.1 50S ribosomal protein L10 [Reichenbachiella sp. MSK19-1]SHK34717.1 large subunit ribosomal protein L10 [Reichenbachiella agariperforans]
MTREEKAKIIEELSGKFQSTGYFYFTDAAGMTVAEVNNFRRKCFESGIEYRVIKNTLIKKALETVDADLSSLNDEVLKGFSGVLFADQDSASAPAKLIKKFKKEDQADRPKLKGASIEYDLFIGEEHLDTLAKLKSKNELIGEVIGLLQSPAKNVISSLQSGGQTLSGLLQTLSER